ncbi:MAG: ABC transporter ATP-binding protein [Alphaproteobacteria bacterium]|nr:ABC transporter ATP-binding protein [Alphaproteobacteria bacterium]
MTIKPFPKTAFKYLLNECIMPCKWAFIVCLLLVFAETGVSNFINWLLAKFVENIKSGANPETLHLALWLVGIIVVCNIVNIFLPKQVLMYRQKHLYFPVQERIYGRALEYIFGHSVNYIINKQTGSLLAKTNQINTLQSTFSVVITQFWWLISDISLKIFLLSVINIWLGILFVFCAGIVALVNYYANKPSDRLNEMQSKAESLYSGWLVDAIANIRLVKQFNRLEYEKKRLSTLLQQYIKIKMKNMLVWFSSYTGVGCFIHLCSTLMLTFSVYLWSKSLINVGDIVFVLLTLNSGFMWMMELCVDYRRFQNNLAYIQAGLEPFIDKHEIEDLPNAKVLKVKKGKIEFKNVCFAYSEQKRIFDGFNLSIESGEKVGIVGLSGNGKTTLINLLQRAYEIQEGQILIDGQDIKTVTQASLHQNLAIIPQETVLFHRSLKDNIGYGVKATDKKIRQAAKIACADEFIRALPEGYDSMVGDRGCKLSGGERQRIAIARAVLRNSPILILDEATSSLDSESESIVAEAINNLLGKQTVIAIAHRLSTLRKMDRIIYLEQGTVAEVGTFDELAKKKNGKFAKLWKMQQLEKKD